MNGTVKGDNQQHPRVGTRVVEAQCHTLWALFAAVAFSFCAAVAALVPHDTGVWLPLHLFLVGGLLSAISGVTQMLSVTWSTAPAPSDGVAAAQLALVAAGAVAVAVGREADLWPLVAIGATLLAVGLLLLAGILLWVRRWSSTDRFHPAIDGYVVAIVWGLVGIVIGALVASGGELYTSRLIEAHLSINVLGLVGVVILSTLPFFMATQLRMKPSPFATALRVRSVVAWASVAVCAVVLGELTDTRWLVTVSFVLEALIVVAVVLMLPRPARKQFDFAGPRLVGLLAGTAWWTISAVVLAVDALDGPIAHRDALLVLVVGAYGQILVASAAYLGPVVRAGGHQRLSAGLALMKSWPGVIAANVAAGLLLFGLRQAAAAVIAAWALDTTVRVALLFRRRPWRPLPG
jgi:nitrite reductase (NO-forming)